ncbi:MAG: hypothetical protein HOC63_01285, partial [Rhodospirillales bacterium]|nr:hypothetical protein [Rhodospirillales bacterium]
MRDDTSNFGQAPRLGQWWVDDRGDKNPAESIDSSLDSVFLRHLGQVKLSATANRIDIMWDTTEVADEALASVVDRLTHCQADVPVKLYFFYYGWVSETYKHRKDAIER